MLNWPKANLFRRLYLPVKIGRYFVGMIKLMLLALVLVSAAVLSAIGTIRLSLQNSEATVPKLVGLSVEEGQELLRPYRMQVKVEDELYSEQWKAGQIISQAPSAGSKTKMGQSAYVLVSLGKKRSQSKTWWERPSARGRSYCFNGT